MSELLQNDILVGLVGGSVAASVLFAIKGLPRLLWQLLLWRFTSEVIVFSDDAAFDLVAEWLSRLQGAKELRRMRLAAEYSDHEQANEFKVSPGLGNHLLWCQGRPVIVRREISKESGSTHRMREQITIRTLGTSSAFARSMVGMLPGIAGQQSDTVQVFLYRGYWRLAAKKARRSLESVVIPAEQRDRIVRDVEHFRQARSWYLERGIPYRRGLLFSGPPGTGKTSLVLALASHFRLRIYALNLGSIADDNALIDAISSVPETALLLIEDIDAAQQDRVAPTAAAPGAPEATAKGVTLSALLNAIDGVFARDGRLLVMTTNHPEKLDAALRRPGRADLTEHIGEMSRSEMRTMCSQYLGELEGARFMAALPTETVTPAELQRRLLERMVA